MRRFLDDFLGELGRAIGEHPRAFCAILSLACLLLAMPRSHAGPLTIEICGQGTGPGGTCGTGSSLPDAVWFGEQKHFGDGVGSVRVKDTVTGDEAYIPVDPTSKQPVPPGWTPGPGVSPVPPGSIPSLPKWSTGITGATKFPSAQAAATGACSVAGRGAGHLCGSTGWYDCDATTGGQPTCQEPLNVNAFGVLTLDYQCPTGYAVGAGTPPVCNLTDPGEAEKEPADKKCGLLRSGNTITMDTKDPDCATSPAQGVGSETNAGNPGQPTVRVKYNPDGSTTITVTNPNKNGTTDVYEWQVRGGTAGGGVGPYGVEGTTKSSGVGTGTGAGTAPGGGEGDGTKPCGGPGQPLCNVKVDESGTTDKANAEGKGGDVKASIDQLKEKALASQTSKDMSDFGVPKYEAPTATPEGSLSLPIGGSDTCTPPTITMRGTVITLDGICTVTQSVKPIIAWALAIFAAMYAWSAYSRRPSGTV